MRSLFSGTGCLVIVIVTLLSGGTFLPVLVALCLFCGLARLVWNALGLLFKFLVLAGILYLLFH